MGEVVRRCIRASLLIIAISMNITTAVTPTHSIELTQTEAASRALAAVVSWEDDFDDASRVGSSSGVAIVGGAVELVPHPLDRQGAVLSWGAPGSFDSDELGGASVLLDGDGVYKMWYYGGSGGVWRIGYATSSDGRQWTKYGPVVSPTLPSEAGIIAYAEVVKLGTEYRMWYSGGGPGNYRIFAATSNNGINWTKQGIVLSAGSPGSADDLQVFDPSVLAQDGTYQMWYTGSSAADPSRFQIFLATSGNGVSWTRRRLVVSPGDSGLVDAALVQNAAVRDVGLSYEMIFSAGRVGYQRLFYAESVDGWSWTQRGLALDVLSPSESTVLVQPGILMAPNGVLSVYYTARGSALQIYLATMSTRAVFGRVTSVNIGIPDGATWGSFTQSIRAMTGSSISLAVRDAATSRPIAGLENRSAGPIDLEWLDPFVHPAIQVEAWLTGQGLVSPSLDAWQVTWIVPSPSQAQGEGLFSNLLWLFAAVTGGVAVLASVAVTMVMRMRKQ